MENSEFIFGPHSVFAAIDSKKRDIKTIYVLEKSRFLKDLGKKKNLGNKINIVKKDQLFRLVQSKNHQGIAAEVSPLPKHDFSFIINLDQKKKPFVLILDSIEDPLNLGAIARSALCLGADAIVIPKNRSAGPTPAASKVSAGALEFIPVIEETNLTRTIEEMKKNGYWIGGLDASGEQFLEHAEIHAPFALVVGSEGKGIRPLIAKNCDMLLKIDQKGPVTSLNAGVAAAIGIYECVRKIKKS